MTATVEESWLLEIVANALLMPGRPPVTEYLVEAMDWFVAARTRPRAEPDAAAPENAFEAWLVARWLREARSEAFRESVQGQRLIAEWERGPYEEAGR